MQPPFFCDYGSNIAMGDSCLFHVRHGRLRMAFPVGDSAEFSNTPWLIGSRPGTHNLSAHTPVGTRGSWRRQDRFWLMTDALAQWTLRQTEVGNLPWEVLEQVAAAPDGGFTAWIDELRGKQELRNDDVTLLAVSLQ